MAYSYLVPAVNYAWEVHYLSEFVCCSWDMFGQDYLLLPLDFLYFGFSYNLQNILNSFPKVALVALCAFRVVHASFKAVGILRFVFH